MLVEEGDRAAAALQQAGDAHLTGDGSRAFFILFGFFGVLCMLWVQATPRSWAGAASSCRRR